MCVGGKCGTEFYVPYRQKKIKCVWYDRKYKKENCIQRYRSDVTNL